MILTNAAYIRVLDNTLKVKAEAIECWLETLAFEDDVKFMNDNQPRL